MALTMYQRKWHAAARGGNKRGSGGSSVATLSVARAISKRKHRVAPAKRKENISWRMM